MGVTCDDCRNEHLLQCAYERQSEQFDGASDWGLHIFSDDTQLRHAGYRAVIEDIGLKPSPACHTVESAAQGHMHVTAPALEAIVTRTVGHPFRLLALTSTGSDANNLLWDAAAIQASLLAGRHVKGYVMIQSFGYGGARGQMAALTSRSFLSAGRTAALDTDLVAMRSQLICPVPLGVAYMHEVGLLAQQEVPGIELYSKACQVKMEANAAAILRDAARFPESAWADAAAAEKYVLDVAAAATASAAAGQGQMLRPNPLTDLEKAAIALMSWRFQELSIGVFLVETFTSDDLLGYSYGFLLAIRHLTAAKGVLLAVDDIMMALRTGQLFSYMHYPAFYPDLVTFGKGFQVCGVAQVSPPDCSPSYTQHSSRSKLFNGLDLSKLGGRVTTGGADRLAMERSVALLSEFAGASLASNSVKLGSKLVEQAVALFRAKGVQRYIRGMAGIWASDALFGGMLRQNLNHSRIIMRLDMTEALVEEVFSTVLKRVNPEAAEARKQPVFPTPSTSNAPKPNTLSKRVDTYLALQEASIEAEIARLEQMRIEVKCQRIALNTNATPSGSVGAGSRAVGAGSGAVGAGSGAVGVVAQVGVGSHGGGWRVWGVVVVVTSTAGDGPGVWMHGIVIHEAPC